MKPKKRQNRLKAIFATLDQLDGCATAQAVAKKLGINVKVVLRAFLSHPRKAFVIRDKGVNSLWITPKANRREMDERLDSYTKFVHGTRFPVHVSGDGY